MRWAILLLAVAVGRAGAADPGDLRRTPPSAETPTNPPILEDFVPAVPPGDILADGLHGVVFVRVLVSEDGRVHRAEIARSDHPELEPAAHRAARECRFLPATRFDEPCRSWAVLTYLFGAGDEIRPAELLEAPPPDPPDASWRLPARARVTVRVDELGCVEDVLRVDGPRSGPLEHAGSWARGALFTPPIRNGEPVAGDLVLVYEYRPEGLAVVLLDPVAEAAIRPDRILWPDPDSGNWIVVPYRQSGD